MTNNKDHFKIAIIGAPTSSGNRGVLALASALVSLFSKGRPDVDLTLLVGSPEPVPLKTVINGQRAEIKALNYRHTYKSGLSRCLPWIVLMSILYRIIPVSSWRRFLRSKIPWIDCLASCDIVGDVRGGDSFSDIYGMQRYIWGFLCAWTAILVHGSITHYPQTYGPYKSGLAKSIARFLLTRSNCVIARDTKSQKVAQDLIGNNEKVMLSPDVAFALEVLPQEPLYRSDQRVIGINVNGLMYNGGYNRSNMFGLELDYPTFLDQLIKKLAEKGPEEILLVPHTYAPQGDVESDNEACEKVKQRLPEELQDRVKVVRESYDQHEIKGIIAQCDAFLGSRMHSCIAALSQGIPCVGVAYSMKFSGVFDSVGMKDWIVDARDVSTEEAVNRSVDLLGNRANVQAELRRNSDSAREKLKNIFGELLRRS